MVPLSFIGNLKTSSQAWSRAVRDTSSLRVGCAEGQLDLARSNGENRYLKAKNFILEKSSQNFVNVFLGTASRSAAVLLLSNLLRQSKSIP